MDGFSAGLPRAEITSCSNCLKKSGGELLLIVSLAARCAEKGVVAVAAML